MSPRNTHGAEKAQLEIIIIGDRCISLYLELSPNSLKIHKIYESVNELFGYFVGFNALFGTFGVLLLLLFSTFKTFSNNNSYYLKILIAIYKFIKFINLSP